MEKKYGITNLLPMILLAVEIGNVADKVGTTAGPTKWFHATGLFDELLALGTVDFSQVRKELSEIDAEERAVIVTKLNEKLDLKDDQLEATIESFISIAERQVSVIVDSIAAIKALKKVEAPVVVETAPVVEDVQA
jgi:hypothetical protein